MRTRIGAAYRPKDNARLDVLAWYEHRLEEKHASTETHLWSIDANYEIDADLRINGKYAGQYQKIGTHAGAAANTTSSSEADRETQPRGRATFQAHLERGSFLFQSAAALQR